MREYRLLSYNNCIDLSNAINELIKQGWESQGDHTAVFYHDNRCGEGIVFSQMMVKFDSQDDKSCKGCLMEPDYCEQTDTCSGINCEGCMFLKIGDTGGFPIEICHCNISKYYRMEPQERCRMYIRYEGYLSLLSRDICVATVDEELFVTTRQETCNYCKYEPDDLCKNICAKINYGKCSHFSHKKDKTV